MASRGGGGPGRGKGTGGGRGVIKTITKGAGVTPTIAKGKGKGVGTWGSGPTVTGSAVGQEVWHAHFTGGDPATAKSHLAACGGAGIKCAAYGCGADAKHGAHVYTKDQGPDQTPNECYLLATCPAHNRPPRSNMWNYPLKEEYDGWLLGHTEGKHGKNNPMKKKTKPKATTIKDIRDGMRITAAAKLYEHVIKKDCGVNAMAGQNYSF